MNILRYVRAYLMHYFINGELFKNSIFPRFLTKMLNYSILDPYIYIHTHTHTLCGCYWHIPLTLMMTPFRPRQLWKYPHFVWILPLPVYSVQVVLMGRKKCLSTRLLSGQALSLSISTLPVASAMTKQYAVWCRIHPSPHQCQARWHTSFLTPLQSFGFCRRVSAACTEFFSSAVSCCLHLDKPSWSANFSYKRLSTKTLSKQREYS